MSDEKQFIQMLQYEIYRRENIIQNYELLIKKLNEDIEEKISQKDKIIKEQSKILSSYRLEENNMLERRAALELFLKQKYKASIEDLDEFITEKKYDDRIKNEQRKRKKDT
mgnify:CR=1 FL=1|jgi:hypothetical protein